MDSIDLAEDRGQWRALGNTVMNLLLLLLLLLLFLLLSLGA
jgi:hypothetical protein